MKKNKTILMLTVGVMVLLASCSKYHEIEQGEETTINSELRKVSFDSGEITRVIGTSWQAGDQIGVTMLNTAKTAVIGSYSNYRYEAASAGASVSFTQKSGDMYYPAGGGDVVFAAYYPYDVNNTNTIAIDTYSNPVDILYASKQCNPLSSGKSINLAFKHKLCRIVLKLIAGTGSPDLTGFIGSVEQGYSMGTLDIKTGVITKTGNAGDCVGDLLATGNTNEYACLIIPQTMPGYSYIAFSTNAGCADDLIISNKAFVEGKQYTYNVTLNNGSTRVESVTITDRTNEIANSTGDI